MKALLSSLVRVCYPFGAVRRVWRGPLSGFRYVVRPGAGLTMALGLDNMFLKFLSEQVRIGVVVYDVGANYGLMSLFFSRAVGATGRVVAFEPVPGNVETLRRNVALNAAEHVDVRPIALGREAGVKNLLFDAARPTMGVFREQSVKMQDCECSLEVPCETLDRLIAQGMPPPDILKIDVEGAAAEVLAGAEKLLGERPPQLFIELHALDADSPELRLVAELEKKWGYTFLDVAGTLQQKPGANWTGTVWGTPPPQS